MFGAVSKSVCRLKLCGSNLRTNVYGFCNQIHHQLTSKKYLQAFQSLIAENTLQSLESGAKMMAELQLKVEQLESQIVMMEKVLEECPSQTKALIQKIQIILDNVEYQKEEIAGIEKRTQKQLQDCKNYSVTPIAKQMLDVADSLRRCYKHAVQTDSSDSKQLANTYKKPLQELQAIFESYGIEQFDPTGQVYDPNRQWAVAKIPMSAGDSPNTVAYTSRTGYTIKGRLLRSAHVGVFQ